MKFAIVVFLISDTSWNFFGGYLVSFFIDGIIELVARYSASFLLAVSETSQGNSQQDCASFLIIQAICNILYLTALFSIYFKEIPGKEFGRYLQMGCLE